MSSNFSFYHNDISSASIIILSYHDSNFPYFCKPFFKVVSQLNSMKFLPLFFQIPSNMKGFNSLNATIDLPPVEIMPPVLKGVRDAKGMLHYTVTGK